MKTFVNVGPGTDPTYVSSLSDYLQPGNEEDIDFEEPPEQPEDDLLRISSQSKRKSRKKRDKEELDEDSDWFNLINIVNIFYILVWFIYTVVWMLLYPCVFEKKTKIKKGKLVQKKKTCLQIFIFTNSNIC